VRLTLAPLDRGPFESPHEPRAKGWGIAGALGYFLPHGALPAVFGSNIRVEIGGSTYTPTSPPPAPEL